MVSRWPAMLSVQGTSAALLQPIVRISSHIVQFSDFFLEMPESWVDSYSIVRVIVTFLEGLFIWSFGKGEGSKASMWNGFPFCGNTWFSQQLKSYQTITFHCSWLGREAGTPALSPSENDRSWPKQCPHSRMCASSLTVQSSQILECNKSLFWVSKSETNHLSQRE
jgi:hypothetical protein